MGRTSASLRTSSTVSSLRMVGALSPKLLTSSPYLAMYSSSLLLNRCDNQASCRGTGSLLQGGDHQHVQCMSTGRCTVLQVPGLQQRRAPLQACGRPAFCTSYRAR